MSPDLPGREAAPPSRLRWAWWLLAYVALGLGIIGVVVPGLPTVPFVLLSAYAAGRGSRRLHGWLLGHPRFGPMIGDWQVHGAVARRSKVLALGTMVLCAALMFLTAPQPWMAVAGTAIMAVVGAWLWRRPEPPR
ncbi:YbaN family protein [Lysobacter sp. A3-1-A15]|uniref:YbaN family protein n=1 Tax=Novilysobacter viscosus TaxID=3098602 RepID=UPI002ED7BC24